MENHPDHLACFLNITTAMQQISLPQKSPLDYSRVSTWPLWRGWIFGYADEISRPTGEAAAQQGEFNISAGNVLTRHGDATSSFKQNRSGEANLQLTFHERNRRTIDGVDCVEGEPGHRLFQGSRRASSTRSHPQWPDGQCEQSASSIYLLRWIAGRHAGVPEFDPLYTIQ